MEFEHQKNIGSQSDTLGGQQHKLHKFCIWSQPNALYRKTTGYNTTEFSTSTVPLEDNSL